mmetsp:Transcript_90231/g.156226  ORF Transcript_90231/g.156226 Transcript_90231/m.156226 type:complete len:208 (+) Transcript_90231:3962-4585(+)
MSAPGTDVEGGAIGQPLPDDARHHLGRECQGQTDIGGLDRPRQVHSNSQGSNHAKALSIHRTLKRTPTCGNRRPSIGVIVDEDPGADAPDSVHLVAGNCAGSTHEAGLCLADTELESIQSPPIIGTGVRKYHRQKSWAVGPCKERQRVLRRPDDASCYTTAGQCCEGSEVSVGIVGEYVLATLQLEGALRPCCEGIPFTVLLNDRDL